MVINKSVGHVCFYVAKCSLYELSKKKGYFRGIENKFISEILWPDTDKLSDEEMVTISKILNGEEL